MAVLALGVALGLAMAAASCSVTNVKHDACTNDAQCASAFGAGSKCQQGFCSDPSTMMMPDCNKKEPDGRPCFGCPPTKTVEFHTACTDVSCQAFDNKKRLTKLTPDGGLPPLP